MQNNELIGILVSKEEMDNNSPSRNTVESKGITNIRKVSDDRYLVSYRNEDIVLEVEDWSKDALIIIGINPHIEADLGMGSDGATTVYMLSDKKVKASKEETLVKEIQALAKKTQLNEQSATIISGLYKAMTDYERGELGKFLQGMKYDMPPQVASLLVTMAEETPLVKTTDYLAVGFGSLAAKRGNADDLFSIKAACGLWQAEMNVGVLYQGNGKFKDRDEIERIVYNVMRKHLDVVDDNTLDSMQEKLLENAIKKWRGAIGEDMVKNAVRLKYRKNKSYAWNWEEIDKDLDNYYRQ